MAYSFTKIEKDKTRTIGFVFSFLFLFYFVSFIFIFFVVKALFFHQFVNRGEVTWLLLFNPMEVFSILGAALAVGWGHWYFTKTNLIMRILKVLKAEDLNGNDSYHRMFQNIIEEVSAATGGRKMEGVVIPTVALNAFSLADFQGRAIIGITEGMLARLSRSQIEAVVGHEAAHIVSGDCLAATISSSLFEVYSGMLSGVRKMLGGGTRFYTRGSGGVMVLLLLVYGLLAIVRFMSRLIRMFISRQREFRADAVAVRLTRDPLSLAEALYTITYYSHGSGVPAEELETIFIVSPGLSGANETGMLANLFLTHPPVESRIHILLDMAHTDVASLAREVEKKGEIPKGIVPNPGTDQAKWAIHKDGKWHGPFEFVQMATFDWLLPDTWIQRIGEKKVKRAFEDKDINTCFVKKAGGTGSKCPKCQVPLTPVMYEGVQISQCRLCHGTFVHETDVKRIIIRQEVGFSGRIKKIAENIGKEEKIWKDATISRDPQTLLKCPKCNHPRARMMRMFYTAAYRVEVDKCSCGYIWFDKDELEILQCMIENRINKS